MADFMIIKVDNSKKSAIQKGKWKNPGAGLYDQLLNAVHCDGKVPDGKDELENAMKEGKYYCWDKLLQEAYMVAPVKDINNSPYGKTPFSRSGCKYPHHVIKGGKLVLSVPGLRAAYICARNQGVLVNHTPENKKIVAHFNRHFKELGLKPVWHHGEFYLMEESEIRIEQNFHDINLYLMEKTGINLFGVDDGLITEASHGKLKADFRLVYDWETGHRLKIVYDLENIEIVDGMHKYMKRFPDKDPKDIIADAQKTIKREGNFDHKSKGQKIMAIVDIEDGNKRLQSATTVGVYPGMKAIYLANEEKGVRLSSEVSVEEFRASYEKLMREGKVVAPKELTVGMIETEPTYKTTHAPALGNPTMEAIGKGRGKRAGNMMYVDTKTNKVVMHKPQPFDMNARKKRQAMQESVIEGSPENPVLSSDFNKEVGSTTPQALWDWMHKNISYDKEGSKWRLRSAPQLYIDKKGNCHDQSYFASFILHSWGYDNWQLYFVEFKEDSDEGGNSHTLTYYLDDGKYYWFENAWEDQASIHGPYNSKEDIKQAVLDAYANDYDLNSHEFDGIVFGEHPSYRLGMNLFDYCSSWHLDDDRKFNKDTPKVVAETKRSTNPNDPESQEAVDITFFDDKGNKIGEASISSVDTNNGFLYNVEVFEGYRGRGYGKAIIGYCLSHYKINELTVEPTNTIAIELYEKYGFKKYMDWEENGRKLIDMRRNISDEIKEAAEWIDQFVHDEVFRESASITTMSDLIKKCKTPEELNKWMKCIQYGWKDKSGKINGTGDNDETSHLFKEYRLQSPNQLIKSKMGLCWDCVELERQWFDHNKYPYAIIFVEVKDGDDCPTHVALIYKQPGEHNEIYWFESAWGEARGIREFKDLETGLPKIVDEIVASFNIKGERIIRMLAKPIPAGTTCEQYYDLAHKSPEVDMGDLFYDEIFNENTSIQVTENTVMDRRYDPPLSYDKLPDHLKDDPIHAWRAQTGIELIHREPTINELFRIWKNWNYMSDAMKEASNKKSIEFFGIDNPTHYYMLLPQYSTQTDSPYYVRSESADYLAMKESATDLGDGSTEPPPNHKGYTMETLPKIMYFGSRSKHPIVQNDKVFLTPYIGIASIFIVDNSKNIAEEFKKQTGHYPERLSCNTSYKEWQEMESQDLMKPLKKVHVTHNIESMQQTVSGSAKGYIHFIDITDIRDQLKLFSSNDPDREVYYDGGKPLKPVKIIEHSIKWEMTYSEANAKQHGQGIVERASVLPKENDLEWMNSYLTEADDEASPEDQPVDDGPPNLNEPGQEEPVPEEFTSDEDGPKPGDEQYAPVPEPVDEPEAEKPVEDQDIEDPTPEEEEPTKPEPKKESMPKQADREESDKNGIRRKKLYIAFIEWCKEYNRTNAFGSIFDKDAFKVSYPFVPDDMRYFYRLANPMLCILSGKLTFFPVAELRKINSQNKKLNEMMIFAGTEKDFRVFNVADKAVYIGTEEGGEIKLGSKLADTFDLYIQNMIDKGDILNGPIEESTEFDFM